MTPLRPLGRYLFRYSGWVVIALLATVTYAAATGAMIALIEPIFSEVLPFGDQVDEVAKSLPIPGAGASQIAEPGSSEISRFNLRGQLNAAYERLKRSFGITPKSVVFFVPALFFLVYVLRGVASFLSSYAFQHAGLGVTSDLRSDLCDHWLHQSSRFHSKHTSGELFSRMVSDIDKMQSAVSNQLLDLIQQSVTLLVLIALLFSTHFKLATICLVAAPAIVFPIDRFGRGMRQTSHRSQERMAELASLLTEMVRGHRIVKAFGMEEFELARFRARHRPPPARQSASAGAVELLDAGGRDRELVRRLPVADLCRLSGPRRSAHDAAPDPVLDQPAAALRPDPQAQQGEPGAAGRRRAAQRVFQMLAIPNEIVERPRAQPLETVSAGCASSRSASAIADDGEYVLEDFSLELPAGEMVALVGPSGAGKSTVVNLLPRFFDPEAGSISIDGVDIRDLPLKNLRSLIGLVTQETILFNDSVRNNIAYGRTEVSLERVREAAAAAYADEFIMAMPQGYDTVIGESGLAALGRPAAAAGDRARAAQERAHPDPRRGHLAARHRVGGAGAEGALQPDAGSHHAGDRAPAVDRDVGRPIVVMERGRIVERGTHAELLELGGLYKRLYDLQFRV